MNMPGIILNIAFLCAKTEGLNLSVPGALEWNGLAIF